MYYTAESPSIYLAKAIPVNVNDKGRMLGKSYQKNLKYNSGHSGSKETFWPVSPGWNWSRLISIRFFSRLGVKRPLRFDN